MFSSRNFSHPHFAEPIWLWLAILGPLVLGALYAYAARARRRQLTHFAASEILASLTVSHSPARRLLKNILQLLSVACIGLALARPQWGEVEQSSENLGQDILFIVDCSRSMLARDIAPSRLQRAKLAILDFAQRHQQSRLGLVAFAGQAFLQCPLTFDHNAFEETLNALDDRTIPIPGTDIGSALDEGYRAMEAKDREKLMIVVTDGEDLQKTGVEKARDLARQNVVIYTIGVGTPAGSQIQLTDEQGRMEFLRDEKGQIVTSKLDETTLRAIATATGGAYFPLGNVGEGFAQIQTGTEENARKGGAAARRFGVDRFYFFIGALVLLLVTESLLGTRRRSASPVAVRASAPYPVS